jgi:hypothetical protein
VVTRSAGAPAKTSFLHADHLLPPPFPDGIVRRLNDGHHSGLFAGVS